MWPHKVSLHGLKLCHMTSRKSHGEVPGTNEDPVQLESYTV